MMENKQQSLKNHTNPKKPTIELKPLQELKGFDFTTSDAFICDMETGVCGPVNQDRETK